MAGGNREVFFTGLIQLCIFQRRCTFKELCFAGTESSDFFLSPAYDLVNTRIHVDDTDFALDKGLFADNFGSPAFKKTHHRGKEDFMEFGRRIGMNETRTERLIAPFLLKQDKVEQLVSRSFLND